MRSERLSSSIEIKSKLYKVMGKCSRGGPILYYDRGSKYLHDEEAHTMILGVSGAGKTRRCTLPMNRSFIEAGEDFIAVDPKGDLYRYTHHLLGQRYRCHVINFRDMRRSEGWNPLWLPYVLYTSGEEDKIQVATEKIKELAYALYPDNMEDPFWTLSARSLFQGAVHALFECGREEEINICSVYRMIVGGDEKMSPAVSCLRELVNTLPEDSAASMLLHSYVSNTAGETRSGIRSVFLEGLSSMITSEGLKAFLSQNDLDIQSLDGSKPLAIYIILPDESSIYDGLAGVLVSQLLTHFIRLAQDRYDGRLPRRLNVCLEELGNIGKAIPDLDHIMAAGRSRNIRLQLVLQSLSQLDDIYGASKAVTITSNADVIMAFRVNHWDTLEQLSGKVGEREKYTNSQLDTEPLLTPAQLGAMETGQALVMISGRVKYVTKLPDYEEMFDCRDWEAPKRPDVYNRKRPQVFHIRDYLWRRKEEECREEEERFPFYRPFGGKNKEEA